MSFQEVDQGWNVKLLLEMISTAPAGTFRALIDTGALITGLTNLEVVFLLFEEENRLPNSFLRRKKEMRKEVIKEKN